MSASSSHSEQVFIPHRIDNYNEYFIPTKVNKDALPGCGCGCNGDWKTWDDWITIEMSDVVTAHTFKNGMSVKDLKELITYWPETYDDGTPTEVWLESGDGLSSQARSIYPLNKRGQNADIIIECKGK